jgi:hypothetical protein
VYSIPEDFDLSICVGTPLDQIRLGKFDVQFVFSSGARIHVQDEIALEQVGGVVTHWHSGTGWTSPGFQALIGLHVVEVRRLSGAGFELIFADQCRLTLMETSSQYESFQIYSPESTDPLLIG